MPWLPSERGMLPWGVEMSMGAEPWGGCQQQLCQAPVCPWGGSLVLADPSALGWPCCDTRDSGASSAQPLLGAADGLRALWM